MRRSLVSAAVLAAVVVSTARVATVRTPAAQGPGNHVVIISLDGFPGWALEDPYLPVPTLRRLAAQGVVARGMRPVNPSVTWPNHTSIVTGVTPARHGVLFNGLLVRDPGVPPRIEPWRDKSEMVRARTLYDVTHEAGLTTAQVDWVAIWNAPTITWEFRERPEPGQAVPEEMIRAGLISAADVKAFSSRNILWRDEMWTTAAVHIIRTHRPNLMLFHLLNLDSTHHRYGPRTPAGMSAMALLDAQVGRIVDAVDAAGLTARTTFFVVSDHGFKTVRRQIRPNAVLAKAGLLTAIDGKVTRSEAYVVPEGGTALVYITATGPAGKLLERTKEALAGLEGIERVVEPAEFAALGLPRPEDNPQMGALFLVAKDGYAFTAATAEPAVVDAPATSLGAHGYVSSDPDLQALFIASGRAVRSGVTLDVIDSLGIAPTAASLLGVKLGAVDGRIMTDVLR
jgi:predicted AlkP superfamily pyrophosphatase or phosphodiesterase